MDDKMLKIICEKWKILQPISSGAFGTVYKAHNIIDDTFVAIKVDKKYDSSARKLSSILDEASILTKLKGIVGIPTLFWSGVDQDCILLVQELLGRDLNYYMKACHRFSMKTVCYLARHLIQILKNIHRNGFVHRDLKPENILLGINENSNLPYIVDFGIAKPYKDKNGKILPINRNKSFVGTQKFASIAAHDGVEVSRKDDLESLFYLFIYLAKGKLPWQNLSKNMTERMKLIAEAKKTILIEELCKNLPESFLKYYFHLKKLSYFDEPDYDYLTRLFKNNEDEGFDKFEWISKIPKSKEKDVSKKEIKSSNLELSIDRPISTVLEENFEKFHKFIDFVPKDPHLLNLPSSLMAKSSSTLSNSSSHAELHFNRISNLEEKILMVAEEDYVSQEHYEFEDDVITKIKNLEIFLLRP